MTAPKCRFCSRALDLTFVDLGETPLANAYLSPTQVASEPLFPLHARLCGSCFLVQVDEVVPAEQIFGDYAYFSSYSSSWLEHARSFVSNAVANLGLTTSSLVIEIASNDGYLLRHFNEMGVPTLGIEPAANVADAARAAHVETLVAFFGADLADHLAQEGRLADLVVANNVLAHVPDLNGFVAGLRRVVKPSGVVSIEVPHLRRLIERVAFDTIYHEHYSYFSLLTLETVLGAHDLRVIDVEELSTHGGSLRIWAVPSGSGREPSTRVAEVRKAEERAGLNAPDVYLEFTGAVERCRQGFLSFLDESASRGESIAAYGAAAKGNTFLNYCGITTSEIPYVVDVSPHKQGLLLPGSHIPIHPPSHIVHMRPSLILILPWNLRSEIIQQMESARDWGARFVTAVPSVAVA